MANTLTITIAANYAGNQFTAFAGCSGYVASIAGNNLDGQNAATVPTSDTAIPLGGMAAPRYLFIQNLSTTHFITVKTGVAGTAIAKLLPGASGGDAILIPLDPSITAPSWIADTATCPANYKVFPT